jgi:hypothetical protein
MTPREDPSVVSALLKETAGNLGTLVADHLKLARVELETDVRIYAGALGISLAAGVLLLVGYLFAWAAVVNVLARLWGAPTGFGVVAGVHFFVGGLALAAVSRKLHTTKVLRESIVEVRRSVRALAQPMKGHAS